MAATAPSASAALGSITVPWVVGGKTAAIVTLKYDVNATFYEVKEMRVGNPQGHWGTVYAVLKEQDRYIGQVSHYTGPIYTGDISVHAGHGMTTWNTNYTMFEVDTPWTANVCIKIKPNSPALILDAYCP
jgi:hypothetical protein